MKNRPLIIVLLLLIGIFVLYSIAWVSISNYLEKVLKQNIFSNQELEISGYPLKIKFTVKEESIKEKSDNIQDKVKSISFNLWSRKATSQIYINLDQLYPANPLAQNKDEVEAKLQNNIMLIGIALNNYSQIYNYLKTKGINLNLLDVFNISEEVNCYMPITVYDKKYVNKINVPISFSISLPNKKIYTSFDEVYTDIPHNLNANIEYNLDSDSAEQTPDLSEFTAKVNQFTYPIKGIAKITANLPDKVFGAFNFIDIIKNLELKIDNIYNNKVLSSESNMVMTNREELLNINFNNSTICSEKLWEMQNKLFSSPEDRLDLLKYIIEGNGGVITPLGEEKLKLVVERLKNILFEPDIKTIDGKVNTNFTFSVPYNADSGKSANYSLYITNSTKTMLAELKGEIPSLNFGSFFIQSPIETHGTLSFKDNNNFIGVIREVADLYILMSLDAVSLEVFKQRLDKFEKNIELIARTLRTLSDDPESMTEEIKYTYNIDFQDKNLEQSKVSKSSSWEDVVKRMDALAVELGPITPINEEAKE